MANDETPQDQSDEVEGTQDGAPDPQKLVADYRKRQAGADAARKVAEQKLADAEKELTQFRAQNRSASETESNDAAVLQERLRVSEERAAAAEAKAEARILDKVYPNARKEYPEVTDEVKLARLEVLLGPEDEIEETPEPRKVSNNAGRAPTQTATKSLRDMTKAEFDAHWASQSADGMAEGFRTGELGGKAK